MLDRAELHVFARTQARWPHLVWLCGCHSRLTQLHQHQLYPCCYGTCYGCVRYTYEFYPSKAYIFRAFRFVVFLLYTAVV